MKRACFAGPEETVQNIKRKYVKVNMYKWLSSVHKLLMKTYFSNVAHGKILEQPDKKYFWSEKEKYVKYI